MLRTYYTAPVTPRPPLLERGVVFAHAHVRGGGEMGRDWWEQGRLLGKRTTFDDFVDVADALAHDGALGLVDGRRIVSRGCPPGAAEGRGVLAAP